MTIFYNVLQLYNPYNSVLSISNEVIIIFSQISCFSIFDLIITEDEPTGQTFRVPHHQNDSFCLILSSDFGYSKQVHQSGCSTAQDWQLNVHLGRQVFKPNPRDHTQDRPGKWFCWN